MENHFTPREQIVETANKLFVYTDSHQWKKMQEEVFTDSVLFDMSSLGAGGPVELPVQQICDMWEKGFSGIDSVHHQAGTYIVKIDGNNASVQAYAIAIHYKKTATLGHTREFVGSYEVGFRLVPGQGWRIYAFKYLLKYMNGNLEFK